jgi:predicted ATP-dependent endonuclease of OLD family
LAGVWQPDVLKQYPKHQYVVTTHSPTAVTSAAPETLLLVQKSGTESTIEPIDVIKTEQLRLFLSEVGASMGDVFGADSILWVEGATEENCFPLIVAGVGHLSLMGPVITTAADYGAVGVDSGSGERALGGGVARATS